MVISPSFDEAKPFEWADNFENGFAWVKYRGKVRRIDTEGRFDKNETF